MKKSIILLFLISSIFGNQRDFLTLNKLKNYEFLNRSKILLSTDSHKLDSANYWLNFGLGPSYFGPLLNSSISYKFNNNILTIRYLNANEFQFNPGGSDYDKPKLKFNELGLLYGKCINYDNISLSLSGGFGFLEGIERGEKIEEGKYKKIELPQFSFPITSSLKLNLTSYVGIGVSFVSNINNQKNLYSGIINVYFGKL
ncbi:MAG: hypothetical protein K9N00_02110 [Candidatus Marinimicrobia bacterium]|nr:hypothetical protein [Candidatus Neomarinimicrobiota bacterium]